MNLLCVKWQATFCLMFHFVAKLFEFVESSGGYEVREIGL
jgi:hypothetical protein